jgi:hypothetical protein
MRKYLVLAAAAAVCLYPNSEIMTHVARRCAGMVAS